MKVLANTTAPRSTPEFSETFGEQVQRRLKPPLKWAGGKRWLVDHIAPCGSPSGNVAWSSLCAGGLAVTLGLMPQRAVLNDINPHTINFYQWLKKGLLRSLPMGNERELFYEYRRRFNELVTNGGKESTEAASLFYYLNRTCYNGLCRFNRKGEFNVPFGRYKKIRYKDEFSEYRSVFANWDFSSGDFEEIELEADDFLYVDPPYDVEFTQYAKENFS